MKKLNLFFVILLVLSITACSKLNNNNTISNPVAQSTQPNVTKDNNSNKKINIVKDANATVENTNLDDFIKTIKPNEYETTQILQDDIDGNGDIEVVVSFGDKNDPMGKFKKNYLLKKTGNNYKNLGELKGNVGLITEIKIVKLDNSKRKYIFASQTNGAEGIGCVVYGLKGNEIVVVDKRFPATGKGVRTLVDDGKGIYKGVDYKEYNDIQKHRLTINYTWDGNSFTKDGKEITYPYNEGNKFVYPQKPEDVIQSYLEAVYLSANNEIKEMITDKNVENFEVLDYFGENGGFEYGLQLKHNTISKNGNIAIIQTTDITSNKYAYFKLINDKGKWKINNISDNQIS